MPTVEGSLSDNLYLIHWPVPSQGLFVDAWRAMEGIFAAGGARAIGVSNFMQDHLDTLLAETTVVPAVNQIELHPTFQQVAVSAGSRAAGVAVEAYSPLGRGSDLEVTAVTELARKRGATPAQIVLAWHLGAGNIVIPKTMHVDRMRENLAAAEITLSLDEMGTVTALDSSARMGTHPARAAFTQMEACLRRRCHGCHGCHGRSRESGESVESLLELGSYTQQPHRPS